MILLLLSIIATYLTFKLLFKKSISHLEPIAFSLIYVLGLSGIVPFIGMEFLNIPYSSSPLEIFVSVMISLSFLVFVFRKEVGVSNKHLVLCFSEIVMLLFSTVIIIRGYFIPMRGWDSFSLYDSRARMFLAGTKLSQMAVLSKYDEFNQLYYFSYPPMTSVLHTLFYATHINHVMIIYGIFYSIFAVYVYLFLRPLKLSNIIKIGLFTIAVLNPILFQHTKLAYTNLPAISFQVVSLYYLVKYTKNGKYLDLTMAALMIAFSNWTRSLEPVFACFFVALIYIQFTKKIKFIKKLYPLVIYLVVSMSTWIIWHYYIKFTIGGLGQTSPSIVNLLTKMVDALSLSNLLSVLFFIYMSYFQIGLYIILALFILIYFALKGFNRVDKGINVVLIVIYSLMAIMFAGTLYFSVTFNWWNQIPDSFLRSNLILIPLISLLCGYVLQSLDTRK